MATDATPDASVKVRPERDIIAACMATAVELGNTRTLLAAVENEKAAIAERLGTEQRSAKLFTELNAARAAEADALRLVATAKDDAIAARDAVINAQDKLVDNLKKKRPSVWRRIGDVLIGAAAIAVLK